MLIALLQAKFPLDFSSAVEFLKGPPLGCSSELLSHSHCHHRSRHHKPKSAKMGGKKVKWTQSISNAKFRLQSAHNRPLFLLALTVDLGTFHQEKVESHPPLLEKSYPACESSAPQR